MKQENKFNIFDLVKQLRKQRMKMVQTQDQYTTLYHVAKELSASRTKRPASENINLIIEYVHLFISILQSFKTLLCTLRTLSCLRI